MMTDLKRFLFGLILVASIVPAQAQKAYRIGIVSPLAASPEPSTIRAFRTALNSLGYVEGKNVAIDVRYAEGRDERFAALFGELLRTKVDVLVAGSTNGVLAAKKATSSVPIVFAGIIDPVSPGIVASFARPGGNVTGATFGVGGSGVGGKWVELLKEAVPGATQVAVIFNPADPMTPILMREIDSAARSLKVDAVRFEVRDDASLAKAFTDISARKMQGLIVPNHPYFAANRTKLVQLSAANRLPAIYFFNLFPESGGLMSYGGNIEDSYRRAASYVDKVLRGAKPADLPVDQPTNFEFVINLKTAKELGLALPKALLLRADRIIE